jgi:hypothetical protein
MRRRLVWLLALGGLLWLYLRRAVRRPEPVVDAPASDPAAELRRKLDESKEPEPVTPLSQPEPEPGPGPDAESSAREPAPAAVVEPEEVDAKRRAVHDRARAAADEMRRSSSD